MADSSLPPLTQTIEFESVGIAESQEAMVKFLTEVQKKMKALDDDQEQMSEHFEDFVELAEKNATREKKDMTIIGKLLKKHREEGKKIYDLRLKEYKMTKDPKVLSNLQKELLTWNKRYKGLKETEKEEEEGAKRAKEGPAWVKKTTEHLEKEKGALSDIVGLGKMLPLLLGGATLIEGLSSMVKSFMEWQRAVASLNQVLYGNNKMLAESEKVMDGFGIQLGVTREELTDIARQGLQLKVFKDVSEDGAKAFRTWSRETILLHKATGLATHTAGELLNIVANRYGLGVRGIRSVAAAFKHVSDTTRLTSEDLTQFIKGMDPLFARLGGLTGKAKKDFTVDMMAIAGSMGDAFGDPTKITDMFEKMLDPLDTTGATMLAHIKRLTGRAPNEIANMLKEGKVLDVYRDFTVSLGQMTGKELNLFAHQTEGVFGDFTALRKFQTAGKESQADWAKRIQDTHKAAQEQKLHADAAKATTTALDQMTNTMKQAIARVWRVFGKVIVDLLEGPARKLSTWMEKLGVWMQGPGRSVLEEWGRKIKQIGAIVWDLGTRAFAWLLEGSPTRLEQILTSAGKLFGELGMAISGLMGTWGKMSTGMESWGISIGPLLTRVVFPFIAALQDLSKLMDALGVKFEHLMKITGVGMAVGTFKGVGRIFQGEKGFREEALSHMDYNTAMMLLVKAIREAPRGADLRPGIEKILKMIPAEHVPKLRESPIIKPYLEPPKIQAVPAPAGAPGAGPTAGVPARTEPLPTVPAPYAGAAPSPTPNVNVTSDPKLTQSVVVQVQLLREIRDALEKKGAAVPPGMTMALASMGG